MNNSNYNNDNNKNEINDEKITNAIYCFRK